MEEKSKLKYLSALEKERSARADVCSGRKFFITFPYPYMNGKLHLGHLFSISKADFFSYYKELQGYNVLFPFSFHCTGMPISASAKKLEDELNGKAVDVSVKKIIEGFEFKDPEPFTDPMHWIRTFPGLCESSLRKFHANIDWRRSFITTDLNKYYDSFVKWQFNRLNRLGYLSFGKRHSIFCPVDEQPCQDHDRRKGENVKPVMAILCKLRFGGGVLLSRMKEGCVPGKLIVGWKKEMVGFEYNGVKCFAERNIFDNIRMQAGVDAADGDTGRSGSEVPRNIDITNLCKHMFMVFGREVKCEVIEKDLGCIVKGMQTDADEKCIDTIKREFELIQKMEDSDGRLAETENFIRFYEPEDEVISRSGGKCVVALTDQWYVNYHDEKWKKEVWKCMERLECTEDTRKILEEAHGWIGRWGFSRSFGLGTRIPWDEKYLIDSLSDSTIYMAMYTFKHFLYSDLEGKEEIFPSMLLSDDVWNYIFLKREITPELALHEEVLKKCRESFEYFYPVDLRVSGKDLLKNHLVFFLFNHVALFDEEYWPRRIFTNGHLMLNSEKMSKSSGNFLTVDESLKKFGVSSTRMCLAVCGDGNEDANFVESNANSFVLKLHSYVRQIEELCSNSTDRLCISKIISEYPEMGFADRFLIQTISANVSCTIRAHEEMMYRDVVKYGFYEMIHAKEMYHILGGKSASLVILLYKSISQLLYPITPSLSRHLIATYFDSDFSLPPVFVLDTDEIDAVAYLKSTLRKLALQTKKKKYSSVEILVGVEYTEWKRRCMGIVDQILCECKLADINISDEIKKPDSLLLSKVISSSKEVLKEFGIPEQRGISFSMDYLARPECYTTKFNEYKVLESYKHYIADNAGMEVFICVSSRADPGNPLFEFK
ncbi:putative tRNA synthetase class I [Ordospora pajunii]|uniref:putative tRNA synthetase class I n=1 Tax=Ordospora pajunii TaxID=3039483 RepID=UPI0029528B66|nr:putative tRNA synthetase class I [Ordospora pajunii]KAH9411301.1 putative tRNA synthetase class I [Ordospora pajunii]